MDDHATCPCGNGLPYAQCCGPLHRGAAASSAEALMRSRYCAFVLADRAYLLHSWHPDTRPAELDLDTSGKTRWLGLSIKGHQDSGSDTAIVEFVARFRVSGGSAVRLHEVSRFVRFDGRWVYLDAEG